MCMQHDSPTGILIPLFGCIGHRSTCTTHASFTRHPHLHVYLTYIAQGPCSRHSFPLCQCSSSLQSTQHSVQTCNPLKILLHRLRQESKRLGGPGTVCRGEGRPPCDINSLHYAGVELDMHALKDTCLRTASLRPSLVQQFSLACPLRRMVHQSSDETHHTQRVGCHRCAVVQRGRWAHQRSESQHWPPSIAS